MTLALSACAVDPAPRPHASLAAYPGATISAETPTVRVTVLEDGETVRCSDRATQAVLWEVNVVKICPPPAMGTPVVRHISIDGGRTVHVVVAKHDFANIDVATGKAYYWGSD